MIKRLYIIYDDIPLNVNRKELGRATTIKECAQIIKKSERTVNSYISSKRIEYIPINDDNIHLAYEKTIVNKDEDKIKELENKIKSMELKFQEDLKSLENRLRESLKIELMKNKTIKI